MQLPQIHSAEDVTVLVEQVGFLPFFAGIVPGFSLEECCPRYLWFSDEADGPWEWKGPIARTRRCLYGKFFAGKAGFVSRAWMEDFINYRRDGYDFDARYDDGLARYRDKNVYDVLAQNGPMLSKALKEQCGFGRGVGGFDGIVTRLQMQTYFCIEDFEYMKDRHGKPYGWGVARYATPEAIFGEDVIAAAYKTDPRACAVRIYDHLAQLLPQATSKQLERLLG